MQESALLHLQEVTVLALSVTAGALDRGIQVLCSYGMDVDSKIRRCYSLMKCSEIKMFPSLESE